MRSAAETASIMTGEASGYGLAYLQKGTLTGARSDAQDSRQNLSGSATIASVEGVRLASPSGGTSNSVGTPLSGHLALQLSINTDDPGAEVDGAFKLAEAQAKQLVSSFEKYISQSGPVAGAGFSFYENYLGAGINVNGSLVSDAGQRGWPTSVIDNGGTAVSLNNLDKFFMLPLQSP